MKFTLFPTRPDLCTAEYDEPSGIRKSVYRRMVDLARYLNSEDTKIISEAAVALAKLAHEHNCTIKFIQNNIDSRYDQVVIESLKPQRLTSKW